MNAALAYENVVKRYGRRRALNGLSLVVPEGCFYGLVGSNGAGKTTSMGAAASLIRVTSGKITVFGEGTFQPDRHGGRLAWMPQDADFPRYARVGEMLTYYAKLQGIHAPHARRQALELLEWVHLGDRARDRIYRLSHGMRRRLTIAQAFLGSPELVIMDEPLSGLDPREVANVRRLLLERKTRQTLVLSSHNLQEIERLCDHVAFIEQGRLVREDRLDAVVGRSRMVRIIVDVPELNPDMLQIPGLHLVFDRPTRSLVVRDDTGAHSAVDTNRIVLQQLMKHGIGIEQVLRGDELESVYLAQFK